MIRLNYQFRAIEPIHTGSDENLGTLRTLRTHKVCVSTPKTITTRFKPEQHQLKRTAIALLVMRMWDKMSDKARVTIYEEVASKLLASTSVRSKYEFLQVFARKLEIRETTVDANRRFDVVDILELFDSAELLEMIRRESQYVMSLFRKFKDDNIRWNKDHKGKSEVAKNTLFGATDTVISPEVAVSDELQGVLKQDWITTTQNQYIDYVPTISGNSTRGMLRRLVMYDFLNLIGVTNIAPTLYHQLFTGGTINDGQGFENIGARLNFINICPMIGLFGSAIGNQTIQGDLRVGSCRLQCVENGNGAMSYHDLKDIVFATRLDSEKLEKDVMVVATEKDKKETHQMKYEYEVFVQNATFDHSFGCTSDNPLIISAFWRMLKLFKANPFITAKGSVGHGEIDLSEIEIPENGDALYLEHCANKKTAMFDFFSSQKSDV